MMPKAMSSTVAQAISSDLPAKYTDSKQDRLTVTLMAMNLFISVARVNKFAWPAMSIHRVSGQ